MTRDTFKSLCLFAVLIVAVLMIGGCASMWAGQAQERCYQGEADQCARAAHWYGVAADTRASRERDRSRPYYHQGLSRDQVQDVIDEDHCTHRRGCVHAIQGLNR